MIFIAIGVVLLIEIGLKIYVRKMLKDMDGAGGMHGGGCERNTIYIHYGK